MLDAVHMYGCTTSNTSVCIDTADVLQLPPIPESTRVFISLRLVFLFVSNLNSDN